MARNRKNQSSSVRFGPALKSVLICLLIGGSGVGYVSLKKQIHELSQQIETREKALKNLREQNARLSKQLDTLRAPPSLHAKVVEMKLGLVRPEPSQIVRLPDPVLPPGETGEGGTTRSVGDVRLLAQQR